MKYLYTKTPDEGCHEVEKGIYGRPVNTSDQRKLLASGWAKTPADLRGNDDGVRKDEEERRQEEVEVTDELIHAYQEKFGKRPHHKMKVETILQKLEESDD